jgi:EAL domain-containing protein (putative c-di-GMP-specific phosphodiesterase class I)
VNVSARQFSAPGFVDGVRRVLAASGLEPSALMLELTESVLLRRDERMHADLAALKSIGVRLAIDDFGTCYSSLRYIRRFAADILKIAKPFIDDLHDETDAALVRTIIALADSLGLRTVAEGIEHRQQLARLNELGCTLGQGYLFARPLAAADVINLLGGALQLAA